MHGNARLESIWGGADAEVQLRTLKTRGSIFYISALKRVRSPAKTALLNFVRVAVTNKMEICD